jgi:hypothetical protein
MPVVMPPPTSPPAVALAIMHSSLSLIDEQPEIMASAVIDTTHRPNLFRSINFLPPFLPDLSKKRHLRSSVPVKVGINTYYVFPLTPSLRVRLAAVLMAAIEARVVLAVSGIRTI